MGRVQDLVDYVLNEGIFDATSAQALRWLTWRHRKMVVRSRCYRKTASAGTTAIGTRDYALPAGIVEIFEVQVAGVTYGKGRHEDISAQSQSLLWLWGTGGVVSPEESATGGLELALIPTPTTAGDAITVRGAFLPPADLLTADDTTLLIPADFDEALGAGGIAMGMSGGPGDYRADLAQGFESKFDTACEELRRQVDRRYRTNGPATIRIAGVNA